MGEVESAAQVRGRQARFAAEDGLWLVVHLCQWDVENQARVAAQDGLWLVVVAAAVCFHCVRFAVFFPCCNFHQCDCSVDLQSFHLAEDVLDIHSKRRMLPVLLALERDQWVFSYKHIFSFSAGNFGVGLC